MTRKDQRVELEAAFCEALKRYNEKRSGEFDIEKQREGDVALGKCLQIASLAFRLDLINYAQYQAYMDRIKTDVASHAMPEQRHPIRAGEPGMRRIADDRDKR